MKLLFQNSETIRIYRIKLNHFLLKLLVINDMKTAIEANLNAVLTLERPKQDVASVALDSGTADRHATDNGLGSLQIAHEPQLPLGAFAIIAPGHGNATVRDFTD